MKPFLIRAGSVIIGLLLVGSAHGTDAGSNQHAGYIVEAPSPIGAIYAEVSAKTKLPPDIKIKDLFNLNRNGPYVLQRLTDRTYFFQENYYATTFYVGDHGVLLFDPLERGGRLIRAAIASVTSLPVVAVVYSHDHADHIGDIGLFMDEAAKAGASLRIIASRATVEKQRFLHSSFPAATEVLAWPDDRFQFEHLNVELHGFARGAHTDDHSAWLLVEEKVLHAPDLLNPDQPPFWQFGGFENYVYFESNLKAVKDLDYLYVNGGHGNVGCRVDFEFYLKFLSELKQAVLDAMKETKWGVGVDAGAVNAHTAYLPNYVQAVSARATEMLRPKYGRFYGYDYATPANAQMIAMALIAYK